MQTLDVGEIATLTSQWYDGDGAPAEPTDIDLTITAPDGTEIAKVKADMVQGVTTDIWIYSQLVDQAGAWRYVFEGVVDGALITQSPQVFLVGVVVTSGPCEPWCTWEEVTACAASGTLDALDPAAREVAIDIASNILFDLTKRKYTGVCVRTASLCYACGSCYPACCSCAPVDGLDLGTIPVWGAWDVFVAGAVLPTTSYTVVDRRWLTRLDDMRWPRGTDVTDPNAFSATWAFGHVVPVAGRRAAALFAAEIAKGCLGMECEIPQRISSITREGVSYPVIDSLSMIQEGRTGVALTDLWVVADAKGRKVRPGMYAAAARHVKRFA